MTTIKVIPRKEGDVIFCRASPHIWNDGHYYNKCSLCSEIFVGAKLQSVCEGCCIKEGTDYPILPSDSSWFEERLGQVVGVDLQGHHCKADRDGDCRWKNCPQLVEHKTHCPLDLNVDLDPEDDLIDTIFAIPPKQDLCKCDQYLQMQAENERLKWLLEAAYRGMMTEFFESRDNDTDIVTLVDENWQRYKQQHNL